jgi:hypothetical protein
MSIKKGRQFQIIRERRPDDRLKQGHVDKWIICSKLLLTSEFPVACYRVSLASHCEL